MRRSVMLAFLGCALIGAGVSLAWLAFRGTPSSLADELVADSFRLERVYIVNAHIPNPEVEKVLEAVTVAAPLDYGFYDQVAFLEAPGLEQYRPREGSKGGVQDKAGRTPTRRVSFSLPRDPETLAKVLVAIRGVHSYEEPVIYIHEAWRSRTTDRAKATRIGGGIRKASSRAKLTVAVNGDLESRFQCRNHKRTLRMYTVFPWRNTMNPSKQRKKG